MVWEQDYNYSTGIWDEAEKHRFVSALVFSFFAFFVVIVFFWIGLTDAALNSLVPVLGLRKRPNPTAGLRIIAKPAAHGQDTRPKSYLASFLVHLFWKVNLIMDHTSWRLHST